MTDEDLIECLIAEADAATTDDADELYRKAAARLSELHAENQRLRDRVDGLERSMFVVTMELESKAKFLDERAKLYCLHVVDHARSVLGKEGGEE